MPNLLFYPLECRSPICPERGDPDSRRWEHVLVFQPRLCRRKRRRCTNGQADRRVHHHPSLRAPRQLRCRTPACEAVFRRSVRRRSGRGRGRRTDRGRPPLAIEAEGYRTAMSDAYRSGQPDPRGDFRLEPATPTVGRVFGLDGKPVARATVLLATRTHVSSLRVPRDEARRGQRVCHDRRTRGVFISGPVRALYRHRDA